MFTQIYSNHKNVLEAAQERISFVFDSFENIIVSISGGKDSTVLAWLALKEAEKRDRKIGLFFFDEEVIYQATADQVEWLMNLKPQHSNRIWLQVEFNMTNSTSLTEPVLKAWEKGQHKKWMRSKGKNNILAYPWSFEPTIRNKAIGLDYYDVIENFERCYSNTAFLIGMRGVESPNRWRSFSKNPVTIQGEQVYWGTKKENGCVALSPLYDWNFHDIWKYTHDEGIRYNQVYDWQFKKGFSIQEMRCSSLIHERAFKSIVELPEFEPKTYDKLCRRIKGIKFAQETGKDAKSLKAQKLPKNFESWITYREFLLKTYPDPGRKHHFEKRFSRHMQNEFVARQQCRQLLLNDYENNVPVKNVEDPRIETIRYYMEVL